MSSKEFPQGLTVAELKTLVANWPDTNEDGVPHEVWVGTQEGLFRPIVRASTAACPAQNTDGRLRDLMLETDEVMA